MSSSDRVDLRVQVGALRLANSVISATRTFGYGLKLALLVDVNRVRGSVAKGVSLEPIADARAPRPCEAPSGLLNAVGSQNVVAPSVVKEGDSLLQKHNTDILTNVFGHSLKVSEEVICRLEDAPGIAGDELNISCPMAKRGGMQLGSNPDLVAEVVMVARQVSRQGFSGGS